MDDAQNKYAVCGIAVMAKASIPGRTKTRLCPPLTPEEAATLNTAFLADTAENLEAASASANVAPSMAFGPPDGRSFFEAEMPSSVALHEIWHPDFGICLKEALQVQFAQGYGAACVLNSDSPTLPAKLLAEAAEVLQRPGDHIVLGPSTDGGYYLLGCKAVHARLFEDIAWSTEAVAAQTLDRAHEIGVPVHVLPAWYDVDDCASLQVLIGEALSGNRFSKHLRSSPARHTARVLKEMIRTARLAERLNLFTAHEPSPLQAAL